MESLVEMMSDERSEKKTYSNVTINNVGSSSRSSGESSGYDYEYDEKALPEPPQFDNFPSFSTLIHSIRPQVRLSGFGNSRFALPPRYAKIWLMFCNVLRLLLPSFLPISKAHQVSSPARELHPTAWLDGLRGFAAFFVVCHHITFAWFSSRIFAGYGSGGDDLNAYIFQLPILRVMISGYPQVAIFFVVSGYAISYKPMKLLHSGRANEFLDSLSMSVFRRHMRLFLPASGVMFFSALMTWMEWYGKGPGARAPPHAASLYLQLCSWFKESIVLADPFAIRPDRLVAAYDVNLWTLPVEFRISMLLYATLLGLCKVRPNMRVLILTGMALFANYKTQWEVFLFLSGGLLADLHFRRVAVPKEALSSQCDCDCGHAHNVPSSPLSETFHKVTGHRWFWSACFFAALWVISIPEVGRGSADSPGYVTLTTWIPRSYYVANKPDHFLIPIAAVFLVYVIDNERALQKFFETRFAQYLGKISFSLYMVHGPILYTLGWHLHINTVAYWGEETHWQYGWAVATSMLVLGPTMIWAADVVWRLIDAKAVKFGRWVGEKVV